MYMGIFLQSKGTNTGLETDEMRKTWALEMEEVTGMFLARKH